MNVAFMLSISAVLVSCFAETEYKEAYFDQIIDHFNFEILGNQTYKQRYLYNDTWWDRGKGPIFFYTGNEAPIDKVWNFTGFVRSIAPSHQALLLFAEHRYYGKSLPFGNSSFHPSKIGWLSIEQALADYAFFLDAFKQNFRADNCPVIAFGGSYGGLLSAFMRFKYPNIIHGSIAASAPIYQLEGLTSGDLYFQRTTKTFRDTSAECESRVRAGFRVLNILASRRKSGRPYSTRRVQRSPNYVFRGYQFPPFWPENEKRKGLKRVSKLFRLCNEMKSDEDYDRFLRWIRNAFVHAATFDYPHPSRKLPAFPVKIMCEKLDSEKNPAAGLREACGVVYNSSGNLNCFDIQKDFFYCSRATGCSEGLVSIAWDYQTCTEINNEGETNGVEDMFPALPFTSAMRDQYCKKAWNVTPRRDFLEVMYGGEDISFSSNIVFSNGDLDPWAPGGVLKNISNSIVAVIIKGAAHQLDLWIPQDGDPQSVIEARNFEVQNIQKWIRKYQEARK